MTHFTHSISARFVPGRGMVGFDRAESMGVDVNQLMTDDGRKLTLVGIKAAGKQQSTAVPARIRQEVESEEAEEPELPDSRPQEG